MILVFSVLNLHFSGYYKAFKVRIHFYFFSVSFSYFINIYLRVDLSGFLSKLGHFLLLKRKSCFDSATKLSNVSIYFVKSFLKSHETKACSTISCEINKGDKIILNIFGVAM